MTSPIGRDRPTPGGLSTGLEALAHAATDVEAKHARRSLQQQLFGTGAQLPIDRYVVRRKLGAGGMGIVYAAHDPELDREVAIKVLRKGDDRRLLREAEALAKLGHPNVVQVFGIGTTDDRAFIVMELVRGQPLDRWQAEGRALRALLDVYLEVGAGLVAAHEAGLVHRDFKPQNVLVGDDGRPRVLDFGLARATDLAKLATDPAIEHARPTAIGRPITRHGAVLGTLAYMAPEQFRGEEATPLADQYSYCLSLWEAVYGAQPFPTDSLARMMTAREDGVLATPATRTSVPRWLRAVLARGLAPDPARRWPTMSALLDALRRGRDRRRRRAVALALGGTACVIGAVVVVALSGRERACEDDVEALRGAWDPQRRAQVQQAVRAVGLPDTEEVERTLLPRIDEYADEWRAAWLRACEATRAHDGAADAALDRARACMQRRRVELSALTEILAEADAQAVANARSAVGRLAPPDACESDATATLRPIDPSIAPELESIRDALATATALKDIGKHHDALAAGQPLLARAHRAGDAQVVAEVQHCLAQVNHRLGREQEANAAFREAYWAATESGDDALAVLAASELMETLVVSAHVREEADRWKSIAESAAARLPDPETLRCEVLMRYGRILEQAGYLGEARAALEEAVEIRRRKRGARDKSMPFTLSYLGMIMMQDGHAEEAKPLHAEAVSIAEETLGPHHTDLGRLLANAAGADATSGDFRGALVKLERARAIFEASGGGHDYDVGTTELNLALLSSELGDGEAAIDHAQRAVAILDQFVGDPKRGASLGMLAEMQLHHGSAAEALTTVERALAVLGDATNVRTCEAHALAAAILQRLGEPARSVVHIEDAERCLDTGPYQRRNFVELWCGAGRPERAQSHAAAAVAGDPGLQAEVDALLARCSG